MRQSGIELLRIVLIFMIILFHVYGSELWNNFNNALFLPEALINSFVVVGVNTFVVISGYFGIKFRLNTVVSILCQTLFYSLFIFGIFVCLGENLTMKDTLQAIFPISSELWWFITVYLLLYIISPILNLSIEKINKQQFQYLILVALFFDCFAGFIFNKISGDGYTIFHFITLYYVARYIKIYSISIKHPLLIYCFMSLATFALNYMVCKFSGHPILFGFRYNNPFLIIAAIALFFIFKQFTFQNKTINTLALYSLGIYMIHRHPLVWDKLAKIIEKISLDNNYITLVYLFILSCSIFIACLIIEKIRFTFLSFIPQIITQKLEKYNINIIKSHEKSNIN